MKKAKVLLGLLLILGSIVGGIYTWKWDTLHHVQVISEPNNPSVFSNEEKAQQNHLQEDGDELKRENQTQRANNRVNILVLGTDNRGNEIARTDLMMFVTANVDTHQVAVISIPRDTRVDIPNVGLTKINHANSVGEALGGVHEGTLESAKMVSNFLGVPINYYLKIDFEGFIKVIDAVGGIEVDLPSPVNDDLRRINLPAGFNHLSGDQALRLSRARYGLPNGDFDRQFNQFYVLSALAHQLLSVSNIAKLPEVINIVYQDLMDTNLSTAEMLAMGLNFKGITKADIKYFQLPGKGITAQDPLVGAAVYYYEPDLDGVQNIVKQAFAGDEQFPG